MEGIGNPTGAFYQSILFGICLWGIILLEEKDLLKAYGSRYERYRETVPQVFPRLRNKMLYAYILLLFLPSYGIVKLLETRDIRLYAFRQNPEVGDRIASDCLTEIASTIETVDYHDDKKFQKRIAAARNLEDLCPETLSRSGRERHPLWKLPDGFVICVGSRMFIESNKVFQETPERKSEIERYARAVCERCAGRDLVALAVGNIDKDRALHVLGVNRFMEIFTLANDFELSGAPVPVEKLPLPCRTDQGAPRR